MLGGINICHRKRDPLTCMMIHNLLVQILQLQSQSALICLVNLNLTAKSALHLSHFARRQNFVYRKIEMYYLIGLSS